MSRLPIPPRQQGAALLVTLFVVLALMIVSVSATRAALHAEKAARGERDHRIALQAAEAALADAERDIEGGMDPESLRAAMFAAGVADTFPEGCGSGAGNPALGLCKLLAPPRKPVWLTLRLAGVSAAVDYGTFTGASMPVGKPALPVRLPRYIIEPLLYTRAGLNASVPQNSFFRITAIGFGTQASTQVVLQSFYLRVTPGEEGA